MLISRQVNLKRATTGNSLVDGTLPLNIGNHFGVELAIDATARDICKGAIWLPLRRCTGSRLLHHLVDLLERQTFGLGNQEVGVDESSRAETTPDEEDGRLEVAIIGANHVWSDDGDDCVPEPVGRSGKTDTTGTDWQWEDLADDDPSTRTPSGGEEKDEDGDECNLGVNGRDVVGNCVAGSVQVGFVEADCNTNDGDKELADQHAKGTPDEKRATTELLNGVERDRSRADVDESKDQRNQKGVADSAGGLQEWSRVVKDEVDTSPEIC